MTIDDLVDKLIAKNEDRNNQNFTDNEITQSENEIVNKVIERKLEGKPFRYLTDQNEIQQELNPQSPVSIKLSDKARLVGYDEENFYVMGNSTKILDVLEKHKKKRKK